MAQATALQQTEQISDGVRKYYAEKSIYRKEKTGQFSKVDNDLWTLPGLSVGARLTLGYMLSKPDAWQFYIEAMAKELHVNKDTAAGYVNELIEAGYVRRERRRVNGRFNGWSYFVYEAGEASGDVATTVSEDSVSGELVAINTYLSNKDFKQEEEDIYINGKSISHFPKLKSEKTGTTSSPELGASPTLTTTQEEIYDQALDNGFTADTARLFALRCEGMPVTAIAIHTAFKALIDRMSDRTQPRIVSLPAYFASTLRDEMERQGIGNVATMSSLPPVDSDVLFYDWLREEDNSDLPW